MQTRGIPSRWTWCGLFLISLLSTSCRDQPAPHESRDFAVKPDSAPPLHFADAAAPPPQPAEVLETDADFNEPVTGKNVTATYQARYAEDEKALFRKKPKGGKYRVLVVPGFVTGFYMQISQIAKDTFAKEDFLDYLQEPSEAVKELGLGDTQELLDNKIFNTQSSIKVNAEQIVRSIKQATGQKIILISHSKGGNDVLAALLLMQKSGTLKKVAGWISVQSGFFGSPVADEAMKSPTLQAAAKLFLEKSGGTLDSLNDATSPVCEKYMGENAAAIAKLVKTMPILSFVSWKPKPRDAQILHPDTILFVARNFMEGKGLKNDGLVPRKNGVLPGTDYIAKVGIDHAEPAMKSPSPVLPGTLNRKKFTKVLLTMLFDQMERKTLRK